MNELDLPDLPFNLQVTIDFLKSVANPKAIYIYRVDTSFNATESRQMTVSKGTIIVSLQEYDEWIFGCPDVKPNSFGFVPKNYLKHVETVRR
jgi:hypothetical protein